MTRQEAVENHRRMWRWIAEQTLLQRRKAGKEEYFKNNSIKFSDTPSNKCYCCEYVNILLNDCQECPVVWGQSFSNCMTLYNENGIGIDSGYFVQWVDEVDYKRAAELAKQIAELPERKF